MKWAQTGQEAEAAVQVGHWAKTTPPLVETVCFVLFMPKKHDVSGLACICTRERIPEKEERHAREICDVR